MWGEHALCATQGSKCKTHKRSILHIHPDSEAFASQNSEPDHEAVKQNPPSVISLRVCIGQGTFLGTSKGHTKL